MEKLSKFVVVGLILTGFGSICSAELSEGRIAYWNFDEGSGNKAYDSSGNYDGDIYEATWVNGISGKALSFDGIDDYVDIPDTSTLNPETFTLSAWIKFNNYNQDNLVVGKHYSGSDGGYWLGVYYDQAQFWLSDEPPVRLHTSETYRDDRWHHIAGVYDGQNQYLYVDGDLAVQVEKIYSIFSTQNIHIGAIVQGQYYGAFDGLIDEVMIYDRAVSSAEIEELYYLHLPEPATLLLLGFGSLAFLRKRRK
jgi:hypothetical protein